MLKLSEEDRRLFRGALLSVWGYIAPDAYGMCEDNEEAVEMCIDAGRLEMFDEQEAQARLRALLAQHPYREVLGALEALVDLEV